MSAKKCSRCGLLSPESAQRCDCGYDFETRELRPSLLDRKSADTRMKRPTVVRVALLTPLCAGVAVAIALANGLEWPATISAAWILVGMALSAAVVAPGLVVARIARSDRFSSGCQVAVVGWGLQLVTGTLVVAAATGSDMSAVPALILSAFGMLGSVVTGLVAVLAGMARDRQHAV